MVNPSFGCKAEPMKRRFVVEVPAYFRFLVEVDQNPDYRGRVYPDAPHVVAAKVAEGFLREYAPDMKHTMTWPISLGEAGEATILEQRVELLCPGEDATPDVFDETGSLPLAMPAE